MVSSYMYKGIREPWDTFFMKYSFIILDVCILTTRPVMGIKKDRHVR